MIKKPTYEELEKTLLRLKEQLHNQMEQEQSIRDL